MIPMSHVLSLTVILFGVGVYGVLKSRNAIIILMSIEIILNAVNINFVAFSLYHGSVDGQIFAIFSIAVAAAEVAVGLAIFLALFKRHETINTHEVRLLKW